MDDTPINVPQPSSPFSESHEPAPWVEKVIAQSASKVSHVQPPAMADHHEVTPPQATLVHQAPMNSASSGLSSHAKPLLLCLGEPLIEQRLSAEIGLQDNALSPVSITLAPSGDVLNTATAFSRLFPPSPHTTPKATILTRIGQDTYGKLLTQFCQQEGIILHPPWHTLKDKSRYTGSYLIQTPQSSESTHPVRSEYYRTHSAGSCHHTEALTYSASSLHTLLSGHRWVYATGVSLALSESYRAFVVTLFQFAKAHGKNTMLTLNWREALWEGHRQCAYETLQKLLPYVDSLQLSEEDAHGWLGMGSEQSVKSYFQEIHQVPMVWYTLADKGSRLYTLASRLTQVYPASQGMPTTHTLNALPIAQKGSTIGAGDGFAGGVLYGLVAEQPLPLCHALGRLVAGLKCTHPQTALGMPFREDVMGYQG
ncbi:MAG: PfkB family carbohydrate kinase [Vampirovibrionales bacterium]